MKPVKIPNDLFEGDEFWDWCDALSLPAALLVILAMVGAVLFL